MVVEMDNLAGVFVGGEISVDCDSECRRLQENNSVNREWF